MNSTQELKQERMFILKTFLVIMVMIGAVIQLGA